MRPNQHVDGVWGAKMEHVGKNWSSSVEDLTFEKSSAFFKLSSIR